MDYFNLEIGYSKKEEIIDYLKDYFKNTNYNYVYNCLPNKKEIEIFLSEIELSSSANRIKIK